MQLRSGGLFDWTRGQSESQRFADGYRRLPPVTAGDRPPITASVMEAIPRPWRFCLTSCVREIRPRGRRPIETSAAASEALETPTE